MSAESNKQALATALAAWNAGNLTRYADLYDSNAVIHSDIDVHSHADSNQHAHAHTTPNQNIYSNVDS